jgi:hypothetical protein
MSGVETRRLRTHTGLKGKIMIKIAERGAIDRERRPAFSYRRRGGALLRCAAALLALGTLAAPSSAKPFQQYLNGACRGTLCKINFAKVPAGQRLTIINASCYIRLARTSTGLQPEIRAAQLLVLGADPATIVSAVTIVPEVVGRSNNEFAFSANHPMTAFAGPQQRMQAYVDIFLGSFSQVACHISGDLAKA